MVNSHHFADEFVRTLLSAVDERQKSLMAQNFPTLKKLFGNVIQVIFSAANRVHNTI
jgi:hypothetical protein